MEKGCGYEHVTAEWPSRAKHQQMRTKCEMVDYAIHRRRLFIRRLLRHDWRCIRTDHYLGRSIWAPEPLRVGRCLRALESWLPNFRTSLLGQFWSDERDFWLNYSLQTPSKRTRAGIASLDVLRIAAVHTIQISDFLKNKKITPKLRLWRRFSGGVSKFMGSQP